MSKGGQRWGAGRPAHRVKGEHLQRVEIGRWHRGGYLRDGSSFSWSWNRGGEPTGSIGVRVLNRTALQLAYSLAGDGDQRRNASQLIGLAYTPCNYGKTRPWFVCPVCERRAGLLYMRAGRFACRQCQRVSYVSQSCDALDRTWRRQSKIEARLGDDWRRPKGMRQRTYDRLIAELVDCEELRDAAFCEKAMRLFGMSNLDGLV
jgi:hypothetical protein